MRIAMFTNNYKPFVGGVPISIERLTEELRNAGHIVTIFAPSYGNTEEEEEGVIRYKSHNIKVLDGKGVLPCTFDRKLEKKFKELKIEMIHVHHPFICGWTAAYLGKKYNIPVSFTYHTRYEQYLHNIKALNYLEKSASNKNTRFSKVSEKMLNVVKEKAIPGYMKAYSKHCDMVFAPTETMREYLQEIGVTSKITVMPTGIPNYFFHDKSSKSQQIRTEYIKDKKFLFCSVSRISKEKNIEFLIRGLYELKQQKGDCFSMIMIGDGPDLDELKELAQQLGLEDNITFVGNIPNQEIVHYYQASDMFVFASKSETQGIVLLEAMSSNIPVVAVKASGVQDVIVNGYNGLMTKEDVTLWAKALKEMMENTEYMEKLKEGALKTALKYSAKNVAREAQSYYQSMILEREENNMQTLYYRLQNKRNSMMHSKKIETTLGTQGTM